jgi:hypothetical protein
MTKQCQSVGPVGNVFIVKPGVKSGVTGFAKLKLENPPQYFPPIDKRQTNLGDDGSKRSPGPKLGHTLLWLGCDGVYNYRQEAETPLKQFMMSSLASAYFASSVAGAIFFGETVLRATYTVFTVRSRRRLCCSGVHGSLLAVRCFLTILRFKHSGLPAFAVAAGERRQSQPS